MVDAIVTIPDPAIPAVPATMAQQVASLATDSSAQVAPVAQVPAPAPVSPTASPVAPAPAAPAAESPATPEKLAEAEKRLKDTQAWAHQKAQEAARLKSELNMVLKNPAFQTAIDSLGVEAGKTPVQVQADVELQQAFREYAAAPSDEAAFAKLVAVSEARGRRGAVQDVQKLLDTRDAEQAVRQRNQLAKETIERTVSQVAPDVPIELFWALSERVERETPQQLTDESERLAWQTERAIAVSRQIVWAKIQAMKLAADRQRAVTKAGQAVMPAGVSSPTQAVPGTVAPNRTLADVIKERQAKLMGSN